MSSVGMKHYKDLGSIEKEILVSSFSVGDVIIMDGGSTCSFPRVSVAGAFVRFFVLEPYLVFQLPAGDFMQCCLCSLKRFLCGLAISLVAGAGNEYLLSNSPSCSDPRIRLLLNDKLRSENCLRKLLFLDAA